MLGQHLGFCLRLPTDSLVGTCVQGIWIWPGVDALLGLCNRIGPSCRRFHILTSTSQRATCVMHPISCIQAASDSSSWTAAHCMHHTSRSHLCHQWLQAVTLHPIISVNLRTCAMASFLERNAAPLSFDRLQPRSHRPGVLGSVIQAPITFITLFPTLQSRSC